MRRSLLLLLALVAGSAPTLGIAVPESDQSTGVERVQALYDRRGDGFDGRWASPEPIATAVAAAEAELAADPASLALRIELLRCLYFQIDFVELPKEERARLTEHAVGVVGRGLEQIHGRSDFENSDPKDIAGEVAGDVARAGALHFWSAVHWGLFGQAKSVMAAVRQGVARRVREHSEVSILLTPDYDGAGPYRALGRLHAVAPKVPLVTGWVKRQRALELLEEAYRRAPAEPMNRLYLAEIWLAEAPERRSQALALLETLAMESPRPDRLVEDTRTLAEARKVLDKLH